MLKFIKMKYHYAYLLYYSVLLSFLPWLKTFLRIEIRDEKNWEQLRYALFYVWNFWSAPVKTKIRKSCSRFEKKRQSTRFWHGFLNLLIWFSLERLYSLKKNWIKQKRKKKKKNRNEVLFLSQTVSLVTSLS